MRYKNGKISFEKKILEKTMKFLKNPKVQVQGQQANFSLSIVLNTYRCFCHQFQRGIMLLLNEFNAINSAKSMYDEYMEGQVCEPHHQT